NKVDQNILNEFYNCADIFVFPSREEPLGLVGIEAMAAGTIVIGSNVGGIKETITHGVNGFLFKSEDISELSHIIMQVYDNFSKVDLLKNNMTQVVSNHSITNSAYKIAEVLQNV